MKNNLFNKLQAFKPLRPFLLLWSTQSLSALGSGMTSFALVIWAFEQSGSALSTSLWCIGAVLGWLPIPLMSANLDVLFRTHIPVDMQGRVYSARNTLQFFTIPLGYFAGGFLVDYIFEPLMAAQESGSLLTVLFGTGKGSGAAFLFLIIGFVGVLPCLIFRRGRHILDLEKSKSSISIQEIL